LVLCFSQAYQLPATVLRFFNVYGPRQSLSNPYTGILTTFLQRLLSDQPPEVYEDGLMTRDFVHANDVVQACRLALELPQTAILNVGSGQSTTILEIAQTLSAMVRPELEPRVIGISRVGDIRHCSADLSRSAALLAYRPSIPLKIGLASVIETVLQQVVENHSNRARDEMAKVGLLK
jgi:dTDP-L-rhamnose 4-epimerase